MSFSFPGCLIFKGYYRSQVVHSNVIEDVHQILKGFQRTKALTFCPAQGPSTDSPKGGYLIFQTPMQQKGIADANYRGKGRCVRGGWHKKNRARMGYLGKSKVTTEYHFEASSEDGE